MSEMVEEKMKQDKEEWVIGLYEDHFNCDDT